MRLERLVLTLTLFLALAAGSAWADETPVDTPNDSPTPSNIEGWDEDADKDDNWTFFGMGYESRQAASGATSASGASGAASSIKKGGSRRGK
ncbi:MAG: hypothetical protein ABFS39_09395 [Pseudomonadota bacterium]